MSQEPRVGFCVNCYLEFDLDGEGMKILSEPKSGRALIEFERRAHSLLMGKDRESLSIQKRIAAENNARNRVPLVDELEETESFEDFVENILGHPLHT